MKHSNPKPIPLLTREAIIKRHLRSHLKKLGFSKGENGQLCPPDLTKETIRSMHSLQRTARLRTESEFISKNESNFLKHFASGREICPERISPRLELIQGGTWQSDLFRLSTFSWSVPVSQGYGRRMRFLLWDDYNDKLIGLLALGDPVFNLKTRDEWIGWTLGQRKALLVNIMDAYVLGALPPYNMLLGGKLIASLVKTQEIVTCFSKRYASSKGIISQKSKSPQLCIVSTTSALGKSSLYNRIALDGENIFEPIGYTSGWGHFHIPDKLFSLMRIYLNEIGDSYANNNRFGEGPNWKLRAIRKCLTLLGMPPDLLKHGINRQVFICSMANNARSVLTGVSTSPDYSNLLTVADVVELAKQRWIIPRSKRKPEYAYWENTNIIKLLSETPITMPFNNNSFQNISCLSL